MPRPSLPFAILLMVGATAAVAASSLIAKGLGGPWGGPLHPVQVAAGRFWGAFLVLLAIYAALPALKRPTFEGVPWALHVARTACGAMGVTLMFGAVARMPLGEATALSFLSPLATMALAVPLLGDRVGPRQGLAAAISVAGMLVLLRPGAEAFQPAALLALGAAAVLGLESILIKKLTEREAPLRLLLVNNALGSLIALPFAALVWTAPGMGAGGLMLLVGMVMLVGQTCFMQALRRAPVSAVSPAFYMTLVFAALYDAAAFGTVPDAAAVAGATLIVVGALVLAAPGRRPGRAGP